MKNKHVLISGAGIAGLTLAYWLKKYGFVPTIVEKYPTLRTEGYKLDIRGSAWHILGQIYNHKIIFSSGKTIAKSLVSASEKLAFKAND